MAHPPFVTRVTDFVAEANDGNESPSPAGVDSELNGAYDVLNQCVQRLRSITNADGTLRNFASATAQSLAGVDDITATADQEDFVTDIVWDDNFTVDNVFVFIGGSKVDPVSVQDDGNGFLEVTLAAQDLGTEVTIAAFESGAGLLSRLQSVDTGDGADLIAIEDAGGLFTAVTVEGALQEVKGDLEDLLTDLGSVAGLIRANGSVDFSANQSMGGFRLTDLDDGVDPQDAVTMAQLTAATALFTALDSYFLRLDGTTVMGGDLDMGNNAVVNMAEGVDPTDGATISQLDEKLDLAGGTMTGPVNFGGQVLSGVAAGVASTDAVNLAQAQSLLASFATLVAYQTAGTYSFAVPAGVTKIRVELFGGGGGGSTAGGASTRAGGGGGAYATATLSVTPEEVLTLEVGAGGAGGASPDAGGDTTITRIATTLVTAGGGGDGQQGSGDGLGGDASFHASVTGFGITGGFGEPVSTDSGDYQEGTGGDCPRGGCGGRGHHSEGSWAAEAGVAPGGGGGAGNASAGSGAAGAILIWY